MGDIQDELDKLEALEFEMINKPAEPAAFVADTESDDDEEGEGKEGEAETSKAAAPKTVEEEFATRFLNEKWLGRIAATGQLLQHMGEEQGWAEVPEDELEFVQQLWFEAEAAETQVVDGVKMRWNAAKQEWIPVAEIDDDFIAQYQSSYGIAYDFSEEDKKREEERAKALAEKEERKEKKKGDGPGKAGWVDMDEKVQAVYVNNLPTDITMDEFNEFMGKCGVIQLDARTNKPKLKLYTNEDGSMKGDGRCCYVKKESIDLALSILDGARLRGKTVIVERAHFEIKGQYDPTKRKRKLTAAQKKRFMESQNKVFEWRPEKSRAFRPVSDCTVILKNLFTIEQMKENAALLLDLKEELKLTFAKFGAVKKVVVYDSNPEGVASVAFESTEESDLAVKMMHGRVVRGQTLEVKLWDGKTKYFVEESEEEKQKRLENWNKFIDNESDEEENRKEEGEDQKEEEEEEGGSEKRARVEQD